MKEVKTVKALRWLDANLHCFLSNALLLGGLLYVGLAATVSPGL